MEKNETAGQKIMKTGKNRKGETTASKYLMTEMVIDQLNHVS